MQHTKREGHNCRKGVRSTAKGDVKDLNLELGSRVCSIDHVGPETIHGSSAQNVDPWFARAIRNSYTMPSRALM